MPEAKSASYNACLLPGKPSTISSERRSTASDTVDYSAVGQIDTGLTKVVITGPGVRLVLRAVARRDELVNAVRAHQTKADPFPVPVLACDDPASLLAKLAALHSTGVLSDEEFAAKKAELLARM